MCIRLLQSEMSSLVWLTTKIPLEVITFSLSLVEIHLYAFIAILVPKLVAMVTPLCSLCTGVSQMNSTIAQTICQKTKLCMDMLHTTEVMANFVIFGQNLVAMATSLRHLQSEMSSLWIGRPRKPPVISNHILAISHRNAFISILVPKLVAMVTPLCPLCTGVSKINSPMAQTLS